MIMNPHLSFTKQKFIAKNWIYTNQLLFIDVHEVYVFASQQIKKIYLHILIRSVLPWIKILEISSMCIFTQQQCTFSNHVLQFNSMCSPVLNSILDLSLYILEKDELFKGFIYLNSFEGLETRARAVRHTADSLDWTILQIEKKKGYKHVKISILFVYIHFYLFLPKLGMFNVSVGYMIVTL